MGHRLPKFLFPVIASVFISIAAQAQAVTFRAESAFGDPDRISFGRFTSDDIASGDTTRAQRIRFTVTGNAPDRGYTIKQVLLNPLTDIESMETISSALVFSSVDALAGVSRASNVPVSGVEDVLYEASGSDITFSYDYFIDWNRLTDSGAYQGRLKFEFIPWEPMSASELPAPVYVDVVLDASRAPIFAVETSSFSDSRLDMTFQTVEEPDQAEDYYIVFRVPEAGSPYTLHQELDGDLRDLTTGEVLAPESLIVSSAVKDSRAVALDATPLSRRMKLLDNPYGAGDEVLVSFRSNPGLSSTPRAGVYTGTLRYSYQISGSDPVYRTVQLAVEVKPVFELKLDSGYFNSLEFSKLEHGEDPVEKDVNVKVVTNTGKPYTVIQKVQRLMSDDLGNTLPEENFAFKGVAVQNDDDMAGRLKTLEYLPVALGDTEVFSSSANGDEVEFKVRYRLAVPRTAKPGDYSTDISYALVEK